MINSLLFLLIIQSKSSCDSPNTILSFTGKCVCLDGFPYGDPESQEGCYKCDYKCNKFAKCISPGKCVCSPPYHGDGVKICEPTMPKILSLYPLTGSMNGGTVVTINYEYSADDSKINKAYCQFESLIVNAEEVTNSTITCISPPHNPTRAYFSILFDDIIKSQEEIFFEYNNETQLDPKIQRQTRNLIENNKNRSFFYLIIVCLGLLIAFYFATMNNHHVSRLPHALHVTRKRRSFWL